VIETSVSFPPRRAQVPRVRRGEPAAFDLCWNCGAGWKLGAEGVLQAYGVPGSSPGLKIERPLPFLASATPT
jgi:hypothetical protein